MLFVQSMTVPRAGRAVPDFTVEGGANLVQGPHTLCEFLHGSCQTKLFLDRDAYIDAFDASVVEREKRDVVAKCDEIVSMLRTPDADVRYVLASRHGAVKGRYKVSFRAFFSGFSVVYHDIPILIRFMEQEQFWDTSPYKRSEQLLAAINGHKGASDHRVLAPEPEFADREVEEFLAQVVSGPFLDLDAFDKREDPRAEGNTVVFDDDDERIRGLVEILSPRRANDRKTWVDVGLALKHAGGGTDRFFELFASFSKTATEPSKVSSDHELRRTWDSFGTACANPLTAKSIAHWARTDNPDAFRALAALPSFAFGIADNSRTLVGALREAFPDLSVPDNVIFEKRGRYQTASPGNGNRAVVSLRAGRLAQYGYFDVASKPASHRRAALRRAVAGEADSGGWLSLFRRLVYTSTLTKNTDPARSAIFYADAYWVKATFAPTPE